MTSGIYAYWDNSKNYYVYVGKDSNIDKKNRHYKHIAPYSYDKQKINMVLQNNPERYEYRVIMEGNYNDWQLNQMEKLCIKSFKTFKYDYPDRNVFNFTQGGDGVGTGKDHPNWRSDLDYDIICDEYINNKLSCREIARKYNINESTIRRRLNKLGIDTGRDKRCRDDLDNDIIRDEYLNKELSCNEIARKYNADLGTIRNRLNNLDIDTSRDKPKNTTGYYRVFKQKHSHCRQGFLYVYQYNDNGKVKKIGSVDIKKLEVKVKEKGLSWKKL